MAVDRYGNPIFATEALPPFTGLTLPTASTTGNTSLQSLVDSIQPSAVAAAPPLQSLLGSIKAPQLASLPDSSNTLSLLLNALGSRTAAASGGGRASTTASGKSSWVSQIKRLAPKYGLDPAAVLAVASTEGLSGAVGDSGTSFGPFQLHVGGALPEGKSRAWAESPAGIDYAMRKIASVARGLKGNAAIAAIVRRFEIPAKPGAEINKAQSRYGNVG